MTREEEIAVLERKLAAREGQPGFKENVEAIKARLAELRGG